MYEMQMVFFASFLGTLLALIVFYALAWVWGFKR